jgi:hypothetical protein
MITVLIGWHARQEVVAAITNDGVALEPPLPATRMLPNRERPSS